MFLLSYKCLYLALAGWYLSICLRCLDLCLSDSIVLLELVASQATQASTLSGKYLVNTQRNELTIAGLLKGLFMNASYCFLWLFDLYCSIAIASWDIFVEIEEKSYRSLSNFNRFVSIEILRAVWLPLWEDLSGLCKYFSLSSSVSLFLLAHCLWSVGGDISSE